MPAMDVAADLAAWAQQRDEAAFRRLVERYSGLVASVCRRQLKNADNVDEAVQAVFIVLAKHAGKVWSSDQLGSWLHGVALRVCRGIRKVNDRRARQVRNSASRIPPGEAPPDGDEMSWAHLRIHLDEAIASLNSSQRQVVIGRFLSGDSHALLATRLGISEDSARMRCSRALEKLQLWFKKRGLMVGAGALAAGLAGESSAAEPALTNACVQAAIHPASAAGASALANSAAFAGTAKAVVIALSLASVFVGGGFGAASVFKHRHEAAGIEGLVAHWTFDERQGTVAGDASGRNNTGTLVNGPTRVVRDQGNALNFDGVDDYVAALHPGPTGASALTVCAWIKTTRVGEQVIVSYGTDALLQYFRWFTDDDALRIRACGGRITVTAKRVNDGGWHQVAIVIPAKALIKDTRFYMDGALLTDVVEDLDPEPNPAGAYQIGTKHPVNIGRDVENDLFFFRGSIDDVRIYDGALSTAEIAELFVQASRDSSAP